MSSVESIAAPTFGEAERGALLGFGERRHLTIMFCDMVGSTHLSSVLDPEELQSLISAFHDHCSRIVDRYGGRVYQYLGDGALVYFGYPVAHENDAERTVLAALEILESIDQVGTDAGRAAAGPIEARIGIATGLTVVGQRGGQAGFLSGVTPNLASRLQALADPNTACVSDATRRIVPELFEFRDLGEHRLKGLGEPVRVWQVVGPREFETRFDALSSASLTPMVDRSDELEEMRLYWERARTGDGQVVVLSGEPGIGKSRLAREFRRQIEVSPHMWLRYQCIPHHVNTAYHPLIQQLRISARISPVDSPRLQFAKLQRLFSAIGVDSADFLPLYANILSIPDRDTYSAPAASPEQEQRKVFDSFIRVIKSLAQRSPLVVLFEDVHWIDPTTLRLLNRLVAECRNLPLLLLITARPEFDPPWIGSPHVRSIQIGRLSGNHARDLIVRLRGGSLMPDGVLANIVETTDGVPLFLEEIGHMLIGSSRPAAGGAVVNGNGFAVPIPETLQDSLVARLDRLGDRAKSLLQVASVVGREFPRRLLVGVSPYDAETTDSTMKRLVNSGLVQSEGRDDNVHYLFKHSLIQEAAYQSILKTARPTLHRRICETIEGDPALAQSMSLEFLAYHSLEAGMRRRGIDYLRRAGQSASERSASQEAVHHLNRALELLALEPEGSERDRDELQILVVLGPVLMATEGSGSARTTDIYRRAMELCATLPESPEHFAASWGWWRIHMNMNFTEGRKWADRLVDLAGRLDDPGLLLQAHHCQWATLFNIGEQVECLQHVDLGLPLYDPAFHHRHASLYGGHDPQVCGLGESALSCWLLGRPEQAARCIADALAAAKRLGHIGSTAHAMDITLMLDRYRDDPAAVLERSTSMIRFAYQQSLPDYRAKGEFFTGWAHGKLVDAREGIGKMKLGMDTLLAIGTREDFPVYFDMLAEIYGILGEPRQGLEAIGQAFEEADRSGLHYWDAELHRRRGELTRMLADADPAEFEECFHRALEVARAQQTLALELRAARSLARVHFDRGARKEALTLLEPVYARFSEGLATNELVSAASLLRSLS